MKLVACPKCRAQYDVADVHTDTVACPCGTTFPARPPDARDAAVTRCAACGALVGDAERICTYCGAEVTRASRLSGPVCPQCYARNPERARHCTACGIAFLPQPVRTRVESLDCPVCPQRRLAARNIDGLWVSECPMCLGLWAPGDVMDQLVERVRDRRRRDGSPMHQHQERHATWQSEISYRRCPECHGTMQRKNFGRRSGVIVDRCASHGIWLDADEMEDVAAYVLDGGLEGALYGDKDGRWVLSADPARAAEALAAEQLMAEERARSLARHHGHEMNPGRLWRGISDLFIELLK